MRDPFRRDASPRVDRNARQASRTFLLVLAGLLLLYFVASRLYPARRTPAPRNPDGKLRALFDASPDAMWVKDREGVYRECNDRVFDLLGIDRRQLLGCTDNVLVGDDLARELRAEDAATMQSGRPQTYTLPVTRHDQVLHQLEVIKVPLRDPAGHVTGTLGVARDVTERCRLEAAYQAWGHAFTHAAFGVVIFDAVTRRIDAANPAFAARRGYTPDQLTGLSVDALYPADLVQARREARRQIDACNHSVVETEHVTRTGERFPVMLDCSVIHASDGRAERVIVYAMDTTARQQAETELRLAAKAFDSRDAIVITDERRTILRVNPAFTRLTGFAADEVVGRGASVLQSPDSDDAQYADVWDGVRRTGSWQGEQVVRTRQGAPKPVRTAVSAVTNASGQVTHYVTWLFDLTREREAQANIERLTFFDPLTNLPNSHYLHTRLAHLLHHPTSAQPVLILFDLDRLKQFNDRCGHTAGDQLLVALAKRLRQHVDPACVLGRVRHGTFAVVKPGVSDSDAPGGSGLSAAAYSERLRLALGKPFQLTPGIAAHMTVSAGWTAFGSSPRSPDAVLEEAELALQCAKAAGGNQARGFAPGMRAERARNDALARELGNAIHDGALELHYQAQADRYGKVVGAEALLRWTRRSGERVPPQTFIHIAEDNGLILSLGRWALEQALRQLVAWADQPSTEKLSLAINVSARQFSQPTFVDEVTRLITTTGANPARLKLEITESTVLDNLDECAHKLARLRATGLHVSIDDFGTGYSSLAYLARLPLDQLKIDRSFVRRLPEDRSDAVVAQTIISMGHRLGLEVIAEGVEVEAQRRFLQMHDCDTFQGYLISRPVSLVEFESLLDHHLQPA